MSYRDEMQELHQVALGVFKDMQTPVGGGKAACLICGSTEYYQYYNLVHVRYPKGAAPPKGVMFDTVGDSHGTACVPICQVCAPGCQKCKDGILTRRVKQALKIWVRTAWPEHKVFLVGRHCKHKQIFAALFEPPLPQGFVSFFSTLPIVAPSKDETKPFAQAQPLRKAALPKMRRLHTYRPGETIAGKYLVRQIFEGGMGRVYVVDVQEQAYVLKVPKDRLSSDQLFVKEAETWVQLGMHPNIVSALAVERPAGMLCVRAEYVPPIAKGIGNLRDVCRLQSLPLPQLLRWAAQFCYGMQHAIDHGLLVHRDIKPENLLIGQDGNLRITDFGVAHAFALNAQDSSSSISGTPAYMPPEQWRGEESGFSTDVYAFGMVLFELAFGRMPWVCSTREELRRAHMDQQPEVPNHPLQSIVLRALAKHPKARFASPRELLQAVQVVAIDQGVRLPPQPEQPDAKREALLAQASLFELGRWQQALEAAKELTQGWPDYAPGWTQLCRVYMERGMIAEGKHAILRSLDVDPTRSPAWNNLGFIHSQQNNPQGAIEAFEQALSWDGVNAGAMSNLANALRLHTDRCAEAIQWLERANRIAPDNPYYLINLSEAHRMNGDASKADALRAAGIALLPAPEREAFLQRLADVMQPEDTTARLVDVGQMLRDGDFERAMPLLQQHVRDNPGSVEGWRNIALAWQDQRNWEEASKAWQQLAVLDPQSARPVIEIARCALKLHQWDEAWRWSDVLAALRDGELDALMIQADVLIGRGDHHSARRLMLKGLEDHPRSVPLRIMFGDFAMRAGAPNAAIHKGFRPALQRKRCPDPILLSAM